MAAGDFYKLTMTGLFLGQQTVNVFHYSGGEGIILVDPVTFISNFLTNTATDIVAMISSQWTCTELRVQDEDPSGLDYSVVTGLFGGGVASSDDLPPFVCWSFLMKRTTKQTFNGHKRFAGVPEAWQDDGVIASGHGTVVATAETALAASVSDGVNTYDPVIMSKILNGVARTSPLGNPVQVAKFMGITTQNTRKFGRGA